MSQGNGADDASASVRAGSGNVLTIRRSAGSGPKVKKEHAHIDIAAMDESDDAAAAAAAASELVVKSEPVVKREPGLGGSSAAAVASAAVAAGMQPPKQRPAFTIGGAPATAASASSSAAAAAAASSPAAAASSASSTAVVPAPAVINSTTIRASLARRPRSILDYLVSLDRDVLDALYTDACTCLTIFRSLHPLAKQYLLRWLFVQAPLRLSLINSWVMQTATSQQAHAHAMRTLWELKLLLKEGDMRADGAAAAAASKSLVKLEGATDTKLASDDDPLVYFNPTFQSCLCGALSNRTDGMGSESTSLGAAAAIDDPDRPTLSQLEEYASERWDALLHWMVGATRPGSSGSPSKEVSSRLLSMGLMAPADDGSSRPRITPSGFAFLFKDVSTQVWDVVLAYMETLGAAGASSSGSASAAKEKRGTGTRRDQVLHFLFRLSFLKLGQGYPTKGLTQTQRILLEDLAAFGLVYIKNAQSAVFYPTRLALNLSSTSGNASAGNAAAAAAAAAAVTADGSSAAAAPSLIPRAAAPSSASAVSSGAGYLLVETTFRLYAFTSSPFHAALLSLFARLDVRLPNLLVCTLTKESVRSALKSHISAADIIAYLDAYACAAQRANTPVLPDNVTDQLRLWEAERNRMALQESHMVEFDSSDSPAVQAKVIMEAFRRPHQLLLHHAAKKILVLTQEGYTMLRAYKLRLNEEMAAAAAAGKQL